LVAARAKFVVDTPAGEPISIEQLVDTLCGEVESNNPPPEPGTTTTPLIPVTLSGRIWAGDLEPWNEGEASFVLAELPADGHGVGHDADNCPFCKRKAAKMPTLIVKFIDEESKTIPIDARRLFGVAKGQHVVVHGTPVASELAEFNTIILLADQIQLEP